MPEGGDLYIQTQNETLDENFVRAYEVAPGKYIKISVTDTGIGMDEETMKRVFDPFFTTKEKERGTVLGLHLPMESLMMLHKLNHELYKY